MMRATGSPIRPSRSPPPATITVTAPAVIGTFTDTRLIQNQKSPKTLALLRIPMAVSVLIVPDISITTARYSPLSLLSN